MAPSSPSLCQPALSADLRGLAEHFKDGPVRFEELFAVLHGRGIRLLIVLLCLPFLTPIPLPVFSTVVGVMIALIGFRLALGQKPHVPARWRHRELPPRMLPKVLRATSRLVGAFERLSKPRLQIFYRHPVLQRLGGLLIGLSGVMLLFPLPVPMSNFLPCAAAALLAAGSFEEDGVVFLCGVAMFAMSVGFFALLALGGAVALGEVWQRLTGG
jgi:hypothetical protein